MIRGSDITAERGFILPMVILALVIMGTLVVAAVTAGLDDRHASLSVQEGTRSFYAAEAGLNFVRASWATQQYDSLVLTEGSSADLGWQTLPENQSRYRAVIQRLALDGPILLTVDGQSAAPRGGQRTISVLLVESQGFVYGVFGETQVSMSGGAGTDSYNSDSAAYSAATARQNGDVGSNGNIVLLGNGTLVRGDAAAGGTVNDPTKVTGLSTNGAPLVSLAGLSCPAGGYTPASAVPAGPGISYSQATGDLSVTGNGHNLTLTAPPISYYFHNVRVSGNASLTLDAGTQHVDIYVSDTLAISGQGVLNQSAKPTNLTFWGCGGNTVAWTLSGGSTSFYAVYAPTHPISLSGNSDFYGAFTGASVSHSGSGRIHFDEALAQRRQGLRVVAPGSWTEVLR